MCEEGIRHPPDNYCQGDVVFTFEACSEAPNYREDWKSDITVWVNGQDCGIWRCPGDFGERRGKNNPDWWQNGATQYGLLNKVEITPEHTLTNAQVSSAVSIGDLRLQDCEYITLRIGNKQDAEYRGGFNLFGKGFGDYDQDIVLTLVY